MKWALDTEFIDTPTCSHLLSLALVSTDDRCAYFEFEYPEAGITPWLRQHVVPQLGGWPKISFRAAALEIRELVGGSRVEPPEFWAYFASYDWYWFCRVFGGMLDLPSHYPHRCRDFADIQHGVPNLYGPEHHALNDARSLMSAMKARGVA